MRLPTRIGWDLNDCEHSSLLDHLADEHGFRRDVPTMFISEAVMFYVNPKAIASLYDEIFEFGQSARRPCTAFTDSMRPFVRVPSRRVDGFFDKQGVTLLAHQARWWRCPVRHAVARPGGAADAAATT